VPEVSIQGCLGPAAVVKNYSHSSSEVPSDNGHNLILLIIYSSISLSSYAAQSQVKIQTNDTVMKTNISGGYLLNIDLDQFNVKGDKSLMFFDQKGLLIGLNNEPFLLLAGPDFDPNNLPDKILKQFAHIKNFLLGPPLIFGDKQPDRYYLIPTWLKELHTLEYLRIKHFEIDDLRFLQNTSIKQLIVSNANIKDKKKLAGDISKLKYLQYLVCDFIFSTQEITEIQLNLPNAVILAESEYNKKIESGEIVFPH
jgi:hypothetical protein